MGMTTFDETQVRRGQPANSGQFREKSNSTPVGALAPAERDLTFEDPVDIDTELSELVMKWHLLNDRAVAQRKRADMWRDREDGYSIKQVEKYDAEADRAIAEMEEVSAAQEPFDHEFSRRGGWTRAYYVPGGHLHTSRACQSIGPTTRFMWLPELSGKDEDEIVDQAGETACTFCFPSAPVDVLARARKFRLPEDDERDKRAAEKIRREAEKTAKAIANPDGTTLKSGYREAKTLVTAERELVSVIHDRRMYLELYDYVNPDAIVEDDKWRDMLVAAIAHKRGMPVEAVVDEYGAKADKKFAKTKKDWQR